ncbi:MAG: ribose-phosphate diphosphokinase [Caldisphaera sp.]|jgi:ribose-phosphate pyrophosphokinase|nr:ribose-phosphate diphosphokinase [Caldisphaera sp.]PMP91570.1 MAG: phosphoribosyl pyrophosphate synthase (PRPP synthase) [Caldisphaera sp.]
MSQIVISGTNETSKEIAFSIAKSMSINICKPVYKIFPDGESYIRIPCDIKNAKPIVVQSLIPPQDKSIIEAVLIGDALQEVGVKDPVLVSPYVAYARQDRIFLQGEPISIRSVLKILSNYYNKLLTIEIHKEESLKYFGKDYVNIKPYVYIAKNIGFNKSKIVVLSPDEGALERAKMLSDYLQCEYDYLVKNRDRVTGEITMQTKELDVKGRDVIIVDDIISTGGTITKAAELLKKLGANKIFVIVAHAMLLGNALDKLLTSGINKIYSANTLPRKEGIDYVDIGPLLADYLLNH